MFVHSCCCPGVNPGCCLQVAPNSVADVQLCYRPGSYQAREEATVCISSQAAGSYEYICVGQVGATIGMQHSGVTLMLHSTYTAAVKDTCSLTISYGCAESCIQGD